MSSWNDITRGPWHLVRRFFVSLPNTPPTPDDEVWADGFLLAGERALWVQMGNRDRRHSIGVARRFAQAHPTASRAQMAGALLHDVGKIECDLGTFARVLATLVGPRTARFQSYHDHEEIGAAMVRDAGSLPETVDLVAGHGPAYAHLEAADY